MTSRKRSRNGGDGGTGIYMREGTTSRVTAADRPYGEFYDFYSVSPENFGSPHVRITIFPCFLLPQPTEFKISRYELYPQNIFSISCLQLSFSQ